MMRAYSYTIARSLFAIGFIMITILFGGVVVTSVTFARGHINLPGAENSELAGKPLVAFIELAQLKRSKKQRIRRSRGLNNQQSNSAVSSGKAASLGTVARRVRQRVPGQLLDARLMKDRRGNLIYRLKILDKKGVMRSVTADAYSGAVLKVR